MSVAELPKPANWIKRRALVILGVAIFVAGGGSGIKQAVTAISRQDLVAAVVATSFAVFTLAPLAAIVVGKIRSDRLVGIVEESGTTFRSDAVATALVACSFTGAAAASALILLFRGRDGAPLPFSSIDRANEPLLMSSLLVLSLTGLAALVAHGRGRLHLTPERIEHIEVLDTRIASWDDVTDVTDAAPQFRGGKPISIHIRDVRRPFVVGNANGYVTNGAALYWMIRHYWLHPENRGELADGRALERLRTEDFVPE